MSLNNTEVYPVFDEIIENDGRQIMESVRNIVKIRSVAGDAEKDSPLGKGPATALQAALDIAGGTGFRTKNLDNYIGYVEFGEGEDYIAVLGHLDTVPEGDHWTFPPFNCEVHKGRIYGRGVLDDKGPILAALYGLKAIRDSQAPLGKRIRIIFGTDEETGDMDVAHYLQQEKPPICGFTPDAEFPVVFAEKGILQVDLTGIFSSDCQYSGDDHLISLNGGDAVNMVPDHADAEIITRDPGKIIRKCEEFAQVSGFSISAEQNNDRVIIRSEGISSHASKPHLGKNAIMQLVAFLSVLRFNPPESCNMARFLQKRIGMDTTGVLFGLDLSDEPSGHLTLNAGLLTGSSREFTLSLDIRYPVTKTMDNVMQNIHASVENQGILITIRKHQPPLYYPPVSNIIRTLSAIYCEVTGDSRAPVAIGGGTYARKLPNIVAFGPYFPGKVYNIHAADESIGCDELIMIAKIYARAMYILAK
jgi:succinyl-diaminopimelate desuccinylase